MMKTKTEKSGFDSSAGASVEPLCWNLRKSRGILQPAVLFGWNYSATYKGSVLSCIFLGVLHTETHTRTHSHHLSPSLHSTQ